MFWWKCGVFLFWIIKIQMMKILGQSRWLKHRLYIFFTLTLSFLLHQHLKTIKCLSFEKCYPGLPALLILGCFSSWLWGSEGTGLAHSLKMKCCVFSGARGQNVFDLVEYKVQHWTEGDSTVSFFFGKEKTWCFGENWIVPITFFLMKLYNGGTSRQPDV